MRTNDDLAGGDLPWFLLGAHSTRLDFGNRDVMVDEALGLNRSWYADASTAA